MCADNGVVEEGVTQTGQEVTAIVAENFLSGDTSACVMSRQCGTKVIPVDIGMAVDTPRVEKRKIAYGTKNMTKEHMDAYVGYLEHEAAEYNEAVECKIEYDCGSVESTSSGVYRIKLLLMNAMHGLKPAQTLFCRQEDR